MLSFFFWEGVDAGMLSFFFWEGLGAGGKEEEDSEDELSPSESNWFDSVSSTSGVQASA
jgi:hypothetical protein